MMRRVNNNVAYRPPETDSEDEYDGFYFGDEFVQKDRRSHFVVDVDEELYNALIKGDLVKVEKQVEMLNFKVNEPVKSGFTLLLHACQEGYLDIVQYLVEEKHADVNKHIDSVTPLMSACESSSTKDEHTVEKIVMLLLKHGAVINVSDKYGNTPFMRACKNGYTAVVRHMIKDVSFDAVDNQGCTPIFFAIEYNHPEIVKLLVDAGVNATIANGKGYTPVQVAQFHGFYDLLDILPKEKVGYSVPSKFLSYNTLRDYIPQIFLKSECPEYFQEINAILLSINMQNFLEHFARERISLADFLSMNDKALEDVGIEYPIYRMKIMRGLLDFHLHHWSKGSIQRVNKLSQESFYQILMLTANHLQHFVIIKSALRFIKHNLKNDKLGRLSIEQVRAMQRNLKAYHTKINDIHKTVRYLASFSPPKNPLYIDYDDYLVERKRNKLWTYFKYTTILLGISVFVCLKVKNF